MNVLLPSYDSILYVAVPPRSRSESLHLLLPGHNLFAELRIARLAAAKINSNILTSPLDLRVKVISTMPLFRLPIQWRL
jgi:hypothetical protein